MQVEKALNAETASHSEKVQLNCEVNLSDT